MLKVSVKLAPVRADAFELDSVNVSVLVPPEVIDAGVKDLAIVACVRIVTVAVAGEFSDLADVAAYTRVVLRLGLAALLGGMLGWERERRHKAAGLRTIAITHSYPPDELREADAIIEHLDELTSDLLRQFP